jgi:hypothetical protein
MTETLKVATACFTPGEFNPTQADSPQILHVVLTSGATLELSVSTGVWDTMLRTHRQAWATELRQILEYPGLAETIPPADLAMAQALLQVVEDNI